MAILQVNEHLFLIELNLERPGFKQFISAWVYRNHKRSILIDPGPTATISIVRQALKDLHVNWLDLILLTHIHIDHAGGTGMLASNFPEAGIICHPKGVPHMTDPEKLWQGSLKVLGDLAEAYGKIVPVYKNAIGYQKSVDKGSLHVDVLETPGHAVHHLSFLIDDYLFAGEAAGVHVVDGEISYMRPATPPKFIYEIYRHSLESLQNTHARYICFGHFGMHENVEEILDAALNQLDLWWETVNGAVRQTPDISEADLLDLLLARDPQLQNFTTLSPEKQQRERYFMMNSLKGMLGAARA
ncbi:MAG: MBL fold metallo-hydrolase [Calditrichaeota bacterium]|nr:MAG: MBL fold metallo-hydrolase [Calditrichota bacterium]